MNKDTLIEDGLRLRPMNRDLAEQSTIPSHVLAYNSKVGLEIEAEGMDIDTISNLLFTTQRSRSMWNIVHDGSLRGRSFEAVFRKPLSGKNVGDALARMQKAIDSSEQEVEFNARTSVHVHVNVRDLTIKQVGLMFGLYLVFEDVLFNFAGTHRKNSNYCTKMQEDGTSIGFIQAIVGNSVDECLFNLMERRVHVYRNNELVEVLALSKYSCVNLCTLSTFGTMEFRHHPGEYRAERLLKWINLLLCLKRWVVETDIDVSELPAMISGAGPTQFLHEVFGEHAGNLSINGIDGSVYEGIRTIQAAVLGRREVNRPRCKASTSLGSSILKKKEEKLQQALLDKLKNAGPQQAAGILMGHPHFDGADLAQTVRGVVQGWRPGQLVVDDMFAG